MLRRSPEVDARQCLRPDPRQALGARGAARARRAAWGTARHPDADAVRRVRRAQAVRRRSAGGGHGLASVYRAGSPARRVLGDLRRDAARHGAGAQRTQSLFSAWPSPFPRSRLLRPARCSRPKVFRCESDRFLLERYRGASRCRPAWPCRSRSLTARPSPASIALIGS